MSDEAESGSAGAIDGGRRAGGGRCEPTPLQSRAKFLQNWSWASVTQINSGLCERGRAQRGINSEAHGAAAEEWEKCQARHLTLLNTISRHAIGTLNPDEMLAKMTEELETGLTYDHIGIAVLEYSTREIVIQAEAGKRRGALGQRIPLGSGLVGNVARNGNMASFHATQAADAAMKPMMADTASAVGLPIFFAEQLHGVLYVESTQDIDFSDEEILLLGTLADLIAGALHNALTFQNGRLCDFRRFPATCKQHKI